MNRLHSFAAMRAHVCTLLVLTLVGALLGAQESVDDLTKQGNSLLQSGKATDALVKFDAALQASPHLPEALYNGGLAAYQSGDYAKAVRYWTTLRDDSPRIWQVRASLVQAYQAMNDLARRDAERTALLGLRRGGNADLAQQGAYVRDQFQAAGKLVVAFEHYELKGDRPVRYSFWVRQPGQEKPELRISLGSYPATNAIWAASHKKEANSGQRLFHLDGYFPNGNHITYGMHSPEPSYDEVRRMVVRLLETGGTQSGTSGMIVGSP